MKVCIVIDCDNDAFQDGRAPAEVSRILEDIANVIDGGCYLPREERLRDSNGNTCGWIRTTGKDSE